MTLLTLLALAPSILNGATLVYWMGNWTPRQQAAIGISLTIDAWGLLIALIVTVIGLAAVLYSIPYLRGQTGQRAFYVLVMLMTSGLIGFCFSGDLFNQFVWLEVFSVAAFALTAFHIEDAQAVQAAFKYLITNSVAAFFIAIGLTLLYVQTGALNIAQIAQRFQPNAAGVVAIGLVVGGYATKAALVPWHFWLPDAHTVAPVPISAFFSGALIKIGIYAVARNLFVIFPFKPGSPVQFGLLVIAAMTMLLGGIQMLQQQSLKRTLAFSSVSQMGYIAFGFALGTPAGFAAAAMHAINHALVKPALFMGVGTVAHHAHVHEMREGGGLARRMPVTLAFMGIGTMALAGLPFFSGFISKTMLEEAAFSQGQGLFAWIAILSSMMTMAGLLRLLWLVFGPLPATKPTPQVGEAPIAMLLPIAGLLIGAFLVGLFPTWVAQHLTDPAASALYDREHYIMAVMEPEATRPPAELEFEAPPTPLNLKDWGVPFLVVLGGGMIAFFVLNPDRGRRSIQPAFLLVKYVGTWSRRLHSGLLSDYVLWNAFGTATTVIGLLLARRPG